ncbi:phosphoribosyltransferase [Ramlibacter monticola]|uniref:Phosphoribosyltransferase n=1 Tax=Ramlibacter monticola TaxID=1926872 RepID=A0A936YZ29_9BURK|nr:phosphoribosyltransferase family protein [Ramlibacter monticola]MBL0391161.1 phosphoribosyltransferase [Ramlibacter monticola]
MFTDRLDAAGRLADALAHWRGSKPLVLAIPRGAVAIGALVARRLEGELDVAMVRKLHAPGAPEFAVGAVDESGWTYVASHAAEVGATASYLDEQKDYQLHELARRRRLYTPGRGPAEVAGRVVIVVDDGLATGATMIAALHAVREHGPKRLVCAVPVASPEAVELVGEYCDEVVCLDAPRRFAAVGQFYASFPQLEDEEVVTLLAQARAT